MTTRFNQLVARVGESEDTILAYNPPLPSELTVECSKCNGWGRVEDEELNDKECDKCVMVGVR